MQLEKDAWLPFIALCHGFAVEGLLDVGNVQGLSSNGSKVGNQREEDRESSPTSTTFESLLFLFSNTEKQHSW